MHPVILKSHALRHYLRRDVAAAIAEECDHREIAIKFTDRFGKRPERIDTPAEVIDFAKSGASSYHISEELWSDPLDITTGMSEKEAREKRIGWDLIIDVDCPDWNLSKTIAKSILLALTSYGLTTRRIKFSGNKGFHIGVPSEAFPITIMDASGTEHRTSDLFPDVPRHMLSLIAERIRDEYVTIHEDAIELCGNRYPWSFLADLIGVEEHEIIVRHCTKCGGTDRVNVFRCALCQKEVTGTDDYAVCPEHGADTMRLSHVECSNRSCKSTTFSKPEVDIESVLHLDIQLISNRHMFRGPYSLHEKSGLVSVVFPEDALDGFEKTMARHDILAIAHPFLSESIRSEADPSQGRTILSEGLARHADELARQPTYSDDVELPEEAISEDRFPPSITNILTGTIKGGEPLRDGRKRCVLILINFLRCMGWDQPSVEQRLYAWNAKLEEPLRDVYIKGQLRHAFRASPKLPPNYDNKEYYMDIGVYDASDPLEKSLKNPVQYAKRRSES